MTINSILFSALDDVDQAKIYSPFSPTITKDTSGLLRLCNHLCGVIVTNGNLANDKQVMTFVNNDQGSGLKLNIFTESYDLV